MVQNWRVQVGCWGVGRFGGLNFLSWFPEVDELEGSFRVQSIRQAHPFRACTSQSSGGGFGICPKAPQRVLGLLGEGFGFGG